MDVLSLIVVALICFLLCLFVPITVYIHLQHRKYAHIPGPPNKGIKGFYLGQLPHFAAERAKGHFFSEMLYPWQLEYGRVFVVFFLHDAYVVTSDQAAIKDLLVTGGHPKSEKIYQLLFTLFGERFMGKGLVTEIDHEKWEKRRLQMNPTFNRGCV